MAPKLTPRQQVFVAEYLVDLNATKAAIAAGYSPKTAEAASSRLLRNVKVAAEIATKQAKRLAKLEITGEKVLQELARIGFANMLDYVTVSENGRALDIDFSRLSREQAAAIQEVTVDHSGGSGDGERRVVHRTRFKLGDKRGSLELLGKHLKLFTDKVENTGADGGPIQKTITVQFVSADGSDALESR